MGKRSYTVRAGDSWERIAGMFYNDQRMFGELMRANPQLAGGKLRPGQTIYLPDQRRNPYVGNAQAALAGIPQNARGQLYNAENASVAQFDPTTGKWSSTPLGTYAPGSTAPPSGSHTGFGSNVVGNQGVLNVPKPTMGANVAANQGAFKNVVATRSPTVGYNIPKPGVTTAGVPQGTLGNITKSPVAPPTSQQNAQAQNQQWIAKYYQQALNSGMNPSDALRWAQDRQQRLGGTGYVSPYNQGPQQSIFNPPTIQGTQNAPGVYQPQTYSAADIGRGLTNAFGVIGSALQKGANVLNQTPEQRWGSNAPVGPTTVGEMLAAQVQQQQQLQQQVTAPTANTQQSQPNGAGAYIYAPPTGASSASPPAGGSVVNTAVAPTVTADAAILAIQAAYLNPSAQKQLPATLDAATIVQIATYTHQTVAQVQASLISDLHYSPVANGSFSRIGVEGGLQDPTLNVTNDAIDGTIPNATWAEASSMTNVPLGYGGPTFNDFGYSPSGRASGRKQKYGAPIIWTPSYGDNP